MSAYFLSLLGAAMLTGVVGVLLPGGSSGIAKHVRLICALVLFCILASPLPKLISEIRDFSFSAPDSQKEESFDQAAQKALDAASRAYFVRALTAHLEQTFEIKEGEICCAVQWGDGEAEGKPTSITLLLSGSARWKNPHELKSYLEKLLDCPCEVAIE